jgi:hypothetical protein
MVFCGARTLTMVAHDVVYGVFCARFTGRLGGLAERGISCTVNAMAKLVIRFLQGARMSKAFLSLLFATLFVALSLPISSYAVKKTPAPEGVTFISGGIGDDEEGEMQRVAKDYNLRMQFALKKTGAFLSDVRVSVVDGKGATVLETVSNGPCLFAKMPKGTYRINASYQGVKEEKKVVIGGKGGTNLPMLWSPETVNEPVEKLDDTRKLHRFHGCWK